MQHRICPGPSPHTQPGHQETETCQDTRPAKMTLLSNISRMEIPLCNEERQGFVCLHASSQIPALIGWKQQCRRKTRSVRWLRVPTKMWPQERSKPSRVGLGAGGKML